MSSGGAPAHPGGGEGGGPACAHACVDAAPADSWSIDRCRLDVYEDEVLGQGATGCVYRAMLGAREVAVKIVHPKKGSTGADRRQMREDVLQVARAPSMRVPSIARARCACFPGALGPARARTCA